jgi:CO/xanthine dehydrogenase Mo-binding subunit
MIPSFEDGPLELRVTLLEHEGAGESHGIGETSLPPVMPAIANAIYNAVGVRIKDLPITPEKILRGLKEKNTAAVQLLRSEDDENRYLGLQQEER